MAQVAQPSSGVVVVGSGSSSQSIVLVEGPLLTMVKTLLCQDHIPYRWREEVRVLWLFLEWAEVIIGGKEDDKSPKSPHLMYQE